MEELEGGRAGIVRIDNRVVRPAGPWSKQVQRLLQHVRQQGFLGTPEPFGFDESGQEIVSHLPGEVSNYPLSENAKSREALLTAGVLLRQYHDATVGFLSQENDPKAWMLPPRPGAEVICHGDFAPYNVVLNGARAVGIIDFDTAHPGPRVWDIAYALYRWAPFTNPKNGDGFGDLDAQIARGKRFCDAYVLPSEGRVGLPALVAERLQALVDYMMAQASADNEAFAANIEDGHHHLYLADIAYIRENAQRIEKGLLGAACR